MLGLLVVAIMIGFPTAFTLMALGVIFGYLGFGASCSTCRPARPSR